MYYALTVLGVGLLAYTHFLLPAACLAFLIIVHEAGHFFVARWCSMQVERFSLGFGPAIPGLSWTSKKGTKFQLAPLPFGGFVEIRGMNVMEEVDPEDVRSYPNRPTWQRVLTIFAGPAMNYVSAIVIAFILYNCNGVPRAHPYNTVDTVQPGSPAEGKLLPDDRILEVDGAPVWSLAADGPGLTSTVMSKYGAPVTLTVVRGEERLHVTITPKLTTAPGAPWQVMYMLGILRKPDMVPVGTFEATWRALKYPVAQSKLIGQTLYKVVTGEEAADPGGAPRIMAELRDAAKRGWVDLLELLAILNVYLGLFNLLPLPALDGGRLVFLIYEMITRRRPNAKIEAMVHMGGVMVLLVLMVLVTLHDFHII